MADKVVSLSIKAKDETSAVLKQLERNLKGLNQIDFAKKSREENKRLREEYARLNEQIEKTRATIARLKQEEARGVPSGNIDAEIANATKLKQAIDQQVEAISRLNVVRNKNGINVVKDLRNAKAERQAKTLAEVEKQAKALAAAEKEQHRLAAESATRSKAAAEAAGVRSAALRRLREELARLKSVDRYLPASEREDKQGEINQVRSAIARIDAMRHASSTATVSELKQQQAAAVAALTPLVAGTQQAQQEQRDLATQVGRTTAQLDNQARVAGRNTLAQRRTKGADWASREVGAAATSQQRGMFGLRPYELTNFGYQINDVVSGLAMGQRPMQVFAQQAGQVAQLFPNLVSGALRFAVSLKAGLIAALGLSVIRATAMNAVLKDFQKTISNDVDGPRYSAKALTDLALSYDRAGMKAKDATSSIKAFMAAGIDQDKFSGLLKTTQTLAKVLGIDVAEATTKVISAFTKNVDGVRELDKSLNFLTAAELQHIRSLEDQGKKSEALAEAQSILQRRMDQTAAKSKGPWSNAFLSLGRSIGTFIDRLARSKLITDFIRDMAKLGTEIEAVAGKLENLTAGDTRSVSDRIIELEGKRGASTGPFADLDNQRLDDEIQELRNRQRTEAYEATSRAAREQADQSEREKKARDDIYNGLLDKWELSQQEADLQDDTTKEQYIQKQLLDEMNAAKKEGIELTAQQVESLREMHGLTFDQNAGTEIINNPGSVVDRIIGIESGGNSSAKNPLSSATGLGQFIESTWLQMFKQHFPDRASGMSREAILALREDAALSRQMVELYVQENARTLRAAGVAVTAGTSYLAHFLGPQGAIDVARAAPGTPIANLLPGSKIRANQSILGGGKTAGDVTNWADRKMGISDQELEVQTRLSEIDSERAEKQKNATDAYDQRIQQMQFETSIARQTAREQFIAQEVEKERLSLQEAGLTLEGERLEKLKAVAGANFDAQNREKDAMEAFNRLLEQRSLLVQKATAAQETQDTDAFTAAKDQIAEVDAQLKAAAASAIVFWQGVGGPDADLAILKINTTIDTLDKLTEKTLVDAKKANEDLAETGVQSFNAMAQAIANGENAAQAFWNGLRQGIGNFIIELTSAIMKQLLFNAISGGGAAGTGGAGGFLSGIVGGFMKFGVQHTGGIAGSATASRMVNPALLASAVRYHTGGIAGLKPNEVPTILMKGEEVLTQRDPRHAGNGGGGAINAKIVNVLDPAQIMNHALQDEEGQRVLINWMNRNSSRVSQALSR